MAEKENTICEQSSTECGAGMEIEAIREILDRNSKGAVVNSRKNCVIAIGGDSRLHGKIKFNTLANRKYICGTVPWSKNKECREWKNIDSEYLLLYLEKTYGLSNDKNILSALDLVADTNRYNPFIDMLNSIEYDGGKHIENLMPDYLGVEKSEYTTECLKLLMLAVISRAFVPGTKFDYVLILYGAQGAGKSTFFMKLCCNEDWYLENLKNINDKKDAAELIQGKLIAEFNELLAMKGVAGTEAIKSFITLKSDEYRAAYAREPEKRKRQCVFVGTTNDSQFLVDRTGNRRFLPIEVNKENAVKNLFGANIDVINDFLQAWGEAYQIYKSGKFRLVLSEAVTDTAKQMQNKYLEDDARTGLIQEWLETHRDDYTCAVQICKEVFKNENPDRRFIRDVNAIMNNSIDGWKKGTTHRFPEYGQQRCYERENKFMQVDEQEKLPFD